jgi:hypothetical protein
MMDRRKPTDDGRRDPVRSGNVQKPKELEMFNRRTLAAFMAAAALTGGAAGGVTASITTPETSAAQGCDPAALSCDRSDGAASDTFAQVEQVDHMRKVRKIDATVDRLEARIGTIAQQTETIAQQTETIARQTRPGQINIGTVFEKARKTYEVLWNCVIKERSTWSMCK